VFGSAGTSPKRIVCTQPRRIAAISLARYVATLVPGATDTIGYKIRFRDTIKPQTRISFVTDGIVLAETISDPLLKRYDCIIIDEAHERTINIDFLLGYMRWLLPKRPELKLVISSATLDISLFSSGFNHAPVISVNERLFPVAIRYEPVIALWQGVAMNAYVDGAVHSIKQLLDGYDSGDILAFFPTVDDIRECLNKLSAMPPKAPFPFCRFSAHDAGRTNQDIRPRRRAAHRIGHEYCRNVNYRPQYPFCRRHGPLPKRCIRRRGRY